MRTSSGRLARAPVPDDSDLIVDEGYEDRVGDFDAEVTSLTGTVSIFRLTGGTIADDLSVSWGATPSTEDPPPAVSPVDSAPGPVLTQILIEGTSDGTGDILPDATTISPPARPYSRTMPLPGPPAKKVYSVGTSHK